MAELIRELLEDPKVVFLYRNGKWDKFGEAKLPDQEWRWCFCKERNSMVFGNPANGDWTYEVFLDECKSSDDVMCVLSAMADRGSRICPAPMIGAFVRAIRFHFVHGELGVE